MAKEYEVQINGQPTWYSDQVRRFKMYFAEPENQVNRDTGILLLIAGYGGNANSHVYQKMRRKFADMYNFVTLQCDYLGWQFMQDDQHPNGTGKKIGARHIVGAHFLQYDQHLELT